MHELLIGAKYLRDIRRAIIFFEKSSWLKFVTGNSQYSVGSSNIQKATWYPFINRQWVKLKPNLKPTNRSFFNEKHYQYFNFKAQDS